MYCAYFEKQVQNQGWSLSTEETADPVTTPLQEPDSGVLATGLNRSPPPLNPPSSGTPAKGFSTRGTLCCSGEDLLGPLGGVRLSLCLHGLNRRGVGTSLY